MIYVVIDANKINKELGWKPSVTRGARIGKNSKLVFGKPNWLIILLLVNMQLITRNNTQIKAEFIRISLMDAINKILYKEKLYNWRLYESTSFIRCRIFWSGLRRGIGRNFKHSFFKRTIEIGFILRESKLKKAI
jgi:hypothetical protein